jgi:dTMP kinase
VSEHHADGAEPLTLQGRAQWRGVLRTPFRNLFYANVTSSIGDWIGVAAILSLTVQILGGEATRGTAFALSGVMIARILPTMLLGPVAGVYVDRWDRRRVLIGTDIGRGLLMALVPFSPDIYALFLATLAIEVMSTLFLPAKDAVVPQLVPREQLVSANQLNLIAAYGTLPIGGAVAALFTGVSLSTLGDRLPFIAERPAAVPIWLNALSFFVSALFVMRIKGLVSSEQRRTSARADLGSPGAWQELKEGFRFIMNHALVRGLVFGVMGAFLAAGAVIAVGQLFAVIVNAGDIGFYILIAVVGTGLFAGILSVGPLSKRLELEQMFAPGIATAGVALAVAALMPRLDLAAIPVFVMGYGGGVAFLAGYTILQERTSDAVRGRTFAAFNTGIRAALFASLVVVPLLVGVIGPEAQGLVAQDGGQVGEGPLEAGDLTGPVPYGIGGVRISLILAGAVALAGAVYSGRGIHQVLSATQSDGLSLGDSGPIPRPTNGLFVAFEGGDGAGKSTQLEMLAEALEEAGHPVTVTREPGGTEIGERVRRLVLDPDVDDMGHRAEALLYAAARAQHVDEVIRPALEEGRVVVCDRFVDSSVVYQGIGRALGEGQVAELNRWATADLLPDLVVVLDIDPVEGMRRVGDDHDRLEGAGLEFHRQVNRGFRDRGLLDPDHYLVVDAAQPADRVHAQVRAAVLARLAGRPESDGDTAGGGDAGEEDGPPPPPVVRPEDLPATEAIGTDDHEVADTVALPPDDPAHPSNLRGHP